MSINVTVSGNPVRIHRGKMVTCQDPSKNEFEKRRLMRLQQVRQQSKDIAENIRNKYKKEKTKCLSEIEKEGEVKLKNWQARKLLELQDQYQEALDEIGLGHKDAARVTNEEDILIEKQESNEKIARERGRIANEMLQIQKNEENLRKAMPRQRKIFTNDVEHRRSNVIAKKGKSPSKKMKKKQQFDSDSENKVPQLFGLNEDSDEESEESVEVVRKTAVLTTSKGLQTNNKMSKEQQTSTTNLLVPTSDQVVQTLGNEGILTSHEDPILNSQKQFLLDTRISDRIKRRTRLNPELDYHHFVDTTLPTKVSVCNCCKCPIKEGGTAEGHLQKPVQLSEDDDKKIKKTTPKESEILIQGDENLQKNVDDVVLPQRKDSDNVQPQQPFSEEVKQIQINDPLKGLTRPTSVQPSSQPVTATKKKIDPKSKSTIPAKPKITLKPTRGRPVYIGSEPTQPVQFYDHPNRYNRAYLPKTTHVEKIDDEELVISPNVLSEEEIREKMRQRDIEAHIRGQVALEKEKINREYRDLLKKLPALQAQERIFEIGTDKEKYHMSRERLEDLEKKRQNRLDNAYEELFVRKQPALITLPKRDEREESQSLNLGSWDVDFDPNDSGKTRCDKLNSLLSDLKSQKESLLKEIQSTLSKETLSQMDEIKSKSTDYTRIKKRKHSSERLSPTTSEIIPEKESVKTKSTKKGTPFSTTTTSIPSPRKKRKLKSKKIILQNTSTQTTPKTDLQSAATSPIVTETDVCSCKKDSLDDLCEIVIKIKDDEKPEIEVNPPFLGKNVKIVTEEVEPEKKESPRKFDSWREQLSRSGSQSTSSTSYLDLPKKTAKKQTKTSEDDVSKSVNSKVKTPEDLSRNTSKHRTPEDVSRSVSTSSSTSSGKRIDPRLLTYIKKLLNMSRGSIDELTVSTASEVSTPSHSVLETPTNNPLLQLMNVMKYFNLDVVDLQKQLSYVSDDNSKHYNTSESVTVSSTTSEKSQFKSCTDIPSSTKVDESNQKLFHYADIAASCTKKINNLTAMIEQVRAEKKKMLESSTSSSDKDLTSYKDLPDKKESKSGDSDDLNKLLTVDYNYADKLKKLSTDEIRSEKRRAEVEQPTDDELLNRLKRLLDSDSQKKTKDSKKVTQVSEKKVVQDSEGQFAVLTSQKQSTELKKDGKTSGVVSEHTTVNVKPAEEVDSFPLFLDIPKLPILEAPSLEKKKKRPPPSKGLRAIAAVPHELSTIIEADSQLSTKLESPTKTSSSSKSGENNKQSNSSDDVSEMDTMETMLISIGMEWAIPTLKKTREALAMTSSSSGSKDSGELSLRDFLSKISASTSKSDSLNESQGISLIQVDNRRTSTPIVDQAKPEGQPIFVTDSDVSSVREKSEEKFYDLNEVTTSKSR